MIRKTALALLFLWGVAPALAAESVQSRYVEVRYEDRAALEKFAWRVTGQKDSAAALPARIDELVEKAQFILGMEDPAFRAIVYAEADGGNAHYSTTKKEIHLSAARVTDGVLAHELAHAIIDRFAVNVPEKSHEILAREVDAKLWSEA